jgi:hypothetical protein
MSEEARLMRAMAAATPKARDQAFVFAVLERAEAKRYRLHSTRALLQGAGYATAIVGLLAPVLVFAPADAIMDGLIGATCLVAFVLFVRRAVRA